MRSIVCGLGMLVWITAASAAPTDGLSTYGLRGTLGPYRIGGELLVENDKVLSAGHYFYASRLTDIPLTGHIDGETVTLDEPGGGHFALHFVSNGSAAGQALTFYNSVGLAGDWTKDGQSLPVKLGFDSGSNGPPPSRRYGDVTDETDARFEAHVQTFLASVLDGDKQTALRWVSYPLRVNGRPTLTIHGDRDLLAHWDEIFSPRLRAAMKEAIPHEMFVRNGSAMIGDGSIWFDAKGASAINEP